MKNCLVVTHLAPNRETKSLSYPEMMGIVSLPFKNSLYCSISLIEFVDSCTLFFCSLFVYLCNFGLIGYNSLLICDVLGFPIFIVFYNTL